MEKFRFFASAVHGATFAFNAAALVALFDVLSEPETAPSDDPRMAIAMLTLWLALNLFSAGVAIVREATQ